MGESSPPLQKRCHVMHFKAHFADHCSMQFSLKLSMKRQAEFVQRDFISKRVAQTRVATELGF